MKKYLCMIICIVIALLSGCGSSVSEQTISDSFNTSTNQKIKFHNIDFEMPEAWGYSSDEETRILIEPEQVSKINMTFAFEINLISDENVYSEWLRTTDFQGTIISAYLAPMGDERSKYEIKERQVCLLGTEENKAQTDYFAFKIVDKDGTMEYQVYAFVFNLKLYALCVPWSEEDEVDYRKDGESILNSISCDELPLSVGAFLEKENSPEEVSYDSIVAGKHTGETVCMEAIVSSLEYDKDIEVYQFDLWYWSNNKRKYVKEDMAWDIWVSDCSSKQLKQVKNLRDGDKIKVTFEVYEDNSFGATSYTDIEILKHGKLSEYGIVVPKEDYNGEHYNEEKDYDSEVADEEREVFITNSGAKYHAAYCRMLKDSKKKIKLKDALAQGYEPCGICNPGR